MPLETAPAALDTRVAELNARYANHAAPEILAEALADPMIGRTALVSSFGAEAVVLLHMVAQIDRTLPVLFVDTEMLFPETPDYQRDVAAHLGLTGIQTIHPDRDETFLNDPNGGLHHHNSDACCALRKTAPLQRALTPFDAWITGRKRVHGGARSDLALFEADQERIKINPLAHFAPSDVADYIANNGLPRHPLVKKGFASIGCAPCTTRVGDGEDPRAGRWRGLDKVECGIHIGDGKSLRQNKELHP